MTPIQRILQVLLVALVLLVAFQLVVWLFHLAQALLVVGLWLLGGLLVLAVVLRFLELVQRKRRY